MSAYALPVLYALFLWWFSTGVMIYLDGLPRHTFRWSMLGATALLALALYGLAASSVVITVAGAFVAFTCGVLVWGWLEMSFLMGFVTGPKKTACSKRCRGWRHFGHAIQAILYHELAIITGAVLVVVVTSGGENQVGKWTFMVLWAMRTSAKLNLFLGVRNLSEELLPEHLQYLKSFFTRKPMNLLFPISVTVSTVIAALVVENALASEASAFDKAGLTLAAALLVLAIVEHWFLVLPLPVAALWGWGLRSRATVAPEHAQHKLSSSARLATTTPSHRALASTAATLPSISS